MNTTKICSKCQQEKGLDLFPKRRKTKDGRDYRCKQCVFDCYRAHFKARSAQKKAYWQKNKTHLNLKQREYTAAHREEKKLYDLQYRLENKDAIRKLKRDWERAHKDDPINKIKKNMRRRLHHVLNGNLKAQKTFDLVGCDATALKTHLEKQFTEGMTWKNYGLGSTKWHIDHIRPCASFDLSKPSEQKKCFSFENLQPLWQVDNLKKADKF